MEIHIFCLKDFGEKESDMIWVWTTPKLVLKINDPIFTVYLIRSTQTPKIDETDSVCNNTCGLEFVPGGNFSGNSLGLKICHLQRSGYCIIF